MNLVRSKQRRGFTLLELLAVIATIAILASLLLPILGRTKVKALRANCISNLNQLGLGWAMYAQDNNGLLVESYPVNNPYAWVQGDVSLQSEASDENNIRNGKLFSYNPSLSIYRCPSDRGVMIAGERVQAVRSYSMNGFMGGRNPTLGHIPPSAGNFVMFYAKDSEIPRPSQLFVLLDEDERSIGDGFYVTDPDGRVWMDFPSISKHRHAFSFALNFADGHSEAW